MEGLLIVVDLAIFLHSANFLIAMVFYLLGLLFLFMGFQNPINYYFLK
jgi:hypothetical protein